MNCFFKEKNRIKREAWLGGRRGTKKQKVQHVAEIVSSAL
jgi:hypothetical protein